MIPGNHHYSLHCDSLFTIIEMKMSHVRDACLTGSSVCAGFPVLVPDEKQGEKLYYATSGGIDEVIVGVDALDPVALSVYMCTGTPLFLFRYEQG